MDKKSIEKERNENIEKSKIYSKENGYQFIKVIGFGGFGVVVIVKKDNRYYAAKFIFPKDNKQISKEKVKDFRGRNLVKILNARGDGINYYMYVMELSYIGDVSKIHECLNNNLIFKNPFLNKFGDNLIRLFCKQIITGIKTFYEGNLVHFDIKPDNILIFKGLELKLIDFSFLTKLIHTKTQRIIGGTPGYFSPEFFIRKDFTDEILQKQDYFALGITIYNLLFDKPAITGYQKEKDLINKTNLNEEEKKENERRKEINEKIKEKNYNIIIDCIQRAMNNIKSQKYLDKDFIEFLCNLIQYSPYERLDFEKIIRNKWLNKNTDEINKIININISDEDNMLLELQKSDFLVTKRKIRKKYPDKINNKNNENNKEIKAHRYIRKGKFKFGKIK